MIPKEAAVSKRAHELWEQAGSPEGKADAFWFQAEEELESQQYGNAHPQPVSPLPKSASGSKPVKNG